MSEQTLEERVEAKSTHAHDRPRGWVMPIGGAEDKDGNGEGKEAILERFVAVAGGSSARIAVIPTASEDQEDAAKKYIKAFGKLGVDNVDILMVETREDANEPDTVEVLETATGIFLTGGAQEKLVTLLAGTLVMDTIRRRNAEGVIVAGTSAGASILAEIVMLGGTGLAGNSGESAARKQMVDIAAGFGLIPDSIVDQHFSQRGRMGRLLSVYASNPGMLSIGLDEDTAVLIDPDGMMEALGTGMVTVVDGRNAVSDYFDREIGEVLTVADSHLTVLGPGRKFDTTMRKAIMEEPKDES